MTVSRGSASAMMFTFSSLLVTMCRNLITFLRETFVGHIIPFDNNVFFHKYVAMLAVFFTGRNFSPVMFPTLIANKNLKYGMFLLF